MSYDPTVPVESNFVRGVSGDLPKMQGNFQDLAPLVSAYLLSGTTPSAILRGFAYGEEGNQVYRTVASGNRFHFQRWTGAAYQSWFILPRDTDDFEFMAKVSGQDPTASFHLATKGYVDGQTISGLADVDSTVPASGDLLRFDTVTNTWGPGRPAVNDLSDASITGPVSGEALIYDGAGWVNGQPAMDVADLDDVDLTGLASGDVLVWNDSTTTWEPRDKGEGIDHGLLDGLGDDDHTIYVLADGSRPITGTISGVAPTEDEHLATKGYVDNLSGLSIDGATTLSGLLDTYDGETDPPTTGEVLTWDGSLWSPAAAAGGADILEIQVFS